MEARLLKKSEPIKDNLENRDLGIAELRLI